MKLRSLFTLFQAIVCGACTCDGGGDRDKSTGTTLNVENIRWPTLNGDINSFKRFLIISKVNPEP